MYMQLKLHLWGTVQQVHSNWGRLEGLMATAIARGVPIVDLSH